ncbi:MAG: DUF6428 family protein [Rhizobiaceae bacterium]|nr:DUF6428 family protein [Rhizobiaceae bacterium]
MTFATLLSSLKPFDGAAALIFEVDDQIIGAGYHVTELRHSASTGIDCGGNVETWQEARLQLLDGPGETHMSLGKFRTIVEKSLDRLPELADAPLLVEFSPENMGLKLMAPDAPFMKDGRVSVKLRDSRAMCKPAQKNMALDVSTNACCSVPSAASACSGSDTSAVSASACCA